MVRSLARRLVPAAAVVFLFGGARAAAQGNPFIGVDENGFGVINFPALGPNFITGVLAPDPGPGGLPLALTYSLSGVPGVVAGDVRLLDSSGALSDIIRFNPAGTGSPGYPTSLVFYSNDGSGNLADTGFPAALYSNVLSIPQGVNYTPSANQPGFIPGLSPTYQFVISPAVIPEPATLTSLAAGLATLAGYGWRPQPPGDG